MARPADPRQDDATADDATPPIEPWLRDRARPVRGLLRGTVALGSLDGLLLIAQAWVLAVILDAAAIDRRPLDTLLGWIVLLVALFLARALVNRQAGRLAFEAGAEVRRSLREAVFERIESLGPAWSRRQRSGAIATTAVDGVEALEKYFTQYLPQMQLTLVVPAAILVFVFPADWISGLVLMLTAPLIPLFMILIGGHTEHMNRRQWRTLTRMGAHFFDAIEGLTTLKLFGAARREARLVGRIAETYRQQTMRVLRVAFLSSAVLEFLASISIAMVAVYVGFRLLYGEIDYLPGLFVLLLAPEFYQPLRSMGSQFHARMDAIGAAEGLVELMHTSPPAAARRPGDDRDEPHEPLPEHGELAFQDVRFAYHPDQPLIRDFCLTMRPGQRVALVGPSGAGKSTIAQLLLGFLRPDAGYIRYAGRDIETLTAAQWREKLAWLPQRPTLFHGSIAANIALGAAEITPAEHRRIVAAARAAHALPFIEALPEGLDTVIGDRGQGLSGGEIQRLALARAFYKDAPIVVLDEPTTSLDRDSERLVGEAIERLTRGRILLIIAHRLQTIRHCDPILFLEHGRVVERGSHRELLERGGRYAAWQAMEAAE
jgi:ATP-binding cassette subfamily C protein CydD